jgi:hypothetical protein
MWGVLRPLRLFTARTPTMLFTSWRHFGSFHGLQLSAGIFCQAKNGLPGDIPRAKHPSRQSTTSLLKVPSMDPSMDRVTYPPTLTAYRSRTMFGDRSCRKYTKKRLYVKDHCGGGALMEQGRDPCYVPEGCHCGTSPTNPRLRRGYPLPAF